jgi:hypothetical protein
MAPSTRWEPLREFATAGPHSPKDSLVKRHGNAHLVVRGSWSRKPGPLYDGLFIYLSQLSSPFDLGPRRRCAPQSAAEPTQAMAGRLRELADMAKCALRVVKNLGRTSAVAFCAVCGSSTLIWRLGDRQGCRGEPSTADCLVDAISWL